MSQAGLGDLTHDSQPVPPSDGGDRDVELYVTTTEYTEEGGKPITHVFGRDEDLNEWHVEVDGHRPSFFVKETEFGPQITNHYAVYAHERHDADGERYTDVNGNPLVRVYTYLPGQVADLREHFDESFEADVFYTNRWLIDQEIYTGIRVAVGGEVFDDRDPHPSDGEDRVERVRVDVGDVKPCEPPVETPRLIITDIEVASEEGMPDKSEARWPVSTIVAYDSYDDEYIGWILTHEDHEPFEVQESACFEADLDELRPFDDESEMLDDYNQYITSRQPDMLSGWYSNDFDYPYLINRCRNLDVWSFKDWSPLGDVYTSNWGPVVKGVETFDMLDGYDKTKRGEYSGKLEDVAQEELGRGKEDVEESHTEMWKQDPVTFLRYNKVDVELVKEIEEEKDIIGLFNRIRKLTGAMFSDCHANIDLLDVLFLRKGKEYGKRLPTATENNRSWYYGAKVLDPQPGIHENAIYFDLASLYPMSMLQLNIGNDTLIGLDDSDYDGETVHSYIDTRPESVKRESEPELEPFYFKSPQDEESFIRKFTDDMISLKEPYRGTKMYMPVKQITNSQYGVLSDADSYGKGFRLFDWRIGESITMMGRKVLEFTMEQVIEKFEERGYDAYPAGGDTDSVVAAVPDADDQKELLDVAHEIAEEVNGEYPEFTEEEFNTSENYMEVEVESLADKLFIPHGATTKTPKKRYAQKIIWDDDALEPCAKHGGSDAETIFECEDCKDGWGADKTKITGLEYVRSDTAGATNEAQKRFVDEILSKPLGEAKESYYAWLNDYVTDLREGDEPVRKLARPKGIGQPLDQYGTATDKPQPTYKGAKYANEFIYGGAKIVEGDKPVMYYVDEIGGDYPVRFPHSWDTGEAGTKVDAVTLDDADDLPDEIGVDIEKMIDKTLRVPLGRMFAPLGWSMDEALSDTDQTDLAKYF